MDYPTAMPDLSTTNVSWVQYAALLKRLGVKNYWWPLALVDQSIKGLDPYSPDLTVTQQLAIAEECRINIVYCIREVLRLKSGGDMVQVLANRGNMGALFCFMACLDFGIVIQRQKGKSAILDLIRCWTTFFGMTNSTSFLFTKSDLRAPNIRKIKETMDHVPRYLDQRTRQDVDNSERLSCVFLKNYVETRIPNAEKDRAAGVGRGLTPFFTQVDEAPYLANAHISIPALYAATTTERKAMRERNLPYCNAITTTAGKRDTDEGAYVYRLIQSGMYYVESSIMDCVDKSHALEVVSKASLTRRPMVNITLNHRQLGITDEEQLDIVATAGPDTVEDANRDYYNVWTYGGAKHPLHVDVLKSLTLSEVDPTNAQRTSEDYIINWYLEDKDYDRFLRENDTILGIDSSETVGKDAAGMVFTDIRTCGVVGTSNVLESSTHKYAYFVANLLVKYPKITLIIEAKNTGRAIMDSVASILIENGINPFRRIFSRMVDDYVNNAGTLKEVGNFDKYFALNHYETHRRHFGFMTTGKSRSHLYNVVLTEAAESTAHLVKDKLLSAQIKGLEENKGRIDHKPGEHDDLVIGWLLTQWMIRHTRNLAFYGIDTHKVLSLVSAKGALLSPEQLKEKSQLVVINEYIDELKAKLMDAPNIMDVGRLTNLLRQKVAEASTYGSITYSYDSIMREVEESRTTKRSLAQSVREHSMNRRSLSRR